MNLRIDAETSAKQKIETDIQNEKVLVISESWCPYAAAAKRLLQQKGARAKIYEMDKMSKSNGDDMRRVVQEKTGQTTVPQIWIGGEHIGGNSELMALDKMKQLDAKLAALGIKAM